MSRLSRLLTRWRWRRWQTGPWWGRPRRGEQMTTTDPQPEPQPEPVEPTPPEPDQPFPPASNPDDDPDDRA